MRYFYYFFNTKNKTCSIIGHINTVINLSSISFAAVKKEITKSTEEVIAKVHVSKRGCYGKKEKKLTLFPSYSQSGCKVECAAQNIQELFGCRPYFFRSQYWIP